MKKKAIKRTIAKERWQQNKKKLCFLFHFIYLPSPLLQSPSQYPLSFHFSFLSVTFFFPALLLVFTPPKKKKKKTYLVSVYNLNFFFVTLFNCCSVFFFCIFFVMWQITPKSSKIKQLFFSSISNL